MDLGNACAAFDESEIEELRAIASQYLAADSIVMKMAGWVGHAGEKILETMPRGWRARIDEATDLALRTSYWIAEGTQPDRPGTNSTNPARQGAIAKAKEWASGERWHMMTAGLTGALGGAGGLATTLADLPVTTTLMMRSIQEVALSYGEDINDEAVRLQCLSVFALGGPLEEDDDAETGFYAARFGVTGKSMADVIARILPRFGIPVSEKLLLQATPVIGAIAGATLNTSFISHYQAMAHVHFRLRRLEKSHDADEVQACFERIVRSLRNAGPKRYSVKG